MNTPNKLTLSRIVLAPFFVLFLLVKEIPYNYAFATIIFIVASVTDLIDGKIARKSNLITTFGKFLDPLADKILTTSAIVCFIELGLTNSVVVVIILIREFLVTSLRLVSVESGVVISASIWGKVKTAYTMGAIIAVLVINSFVQIFPIVDMNIIKLISNILMAIAGVITVLSGIEYLIKNIKHVDFNS